MTESLIEELAGVQHKIWSHWMKYLFSVCAESLSGSTIISPDKTKHWKRQANTPYSELTEREKESDRDQARKTLDVLKG